MKALTMIDSIYQGDGYQESTKILSVPSDPIFQYKISRFPLEVPFLSEQLEFKPYDVTFSKYESMLTRVRLRVGVLGNNQTLSLFSKDEDFNPYIYYYTNSKASLGEPENIEDLLYKDSKFLTPLGIYALLFRKCYGNDEFRRVINSTLLKEYSKIRTQGEVVYIRDKDIALSCYKELRNLFNSDSNKELVRNSLIMSPYIFIWRD